MVRLSRDHLMQAALAGQPLDAVVIDCHAHLGAYHNFTVPDHAPMDLVREMDRYGIQQAWLSHFAAIGPDSQWGNDRLVEACRAHPGRLVGYVAVNPNQPGQIRSELERCLDADCVRGIKLHPAHHQYPVDGPAYRTMLALAHERRCFVLSHSWGSSALLAELSDQFCDAIFVVAHTPWLVARGQQGWLSLAVHRENVYLDTATSWTLHGLLEMIVGEVGAGKVLFGSDMPFFSVGVQIGTIVFARISEQEKRLILGLNMRRLIAESKHSLDASGA